MLGLPTTATAPFCPSEVRGTVDIPTAEPGWRRLLRFLGPGLLVSVGYMDPGNWATDIEAGSRFNYDLLGVVLLSSLAAMVLQCLAVRLGLVTGRDLAQLCRERLPRRVNLTLWALAELAIVACDLAEVLGCALAFHLLLKVSLPVGIALTALDTVLVLAFKGRGFRQLEAIVLGLVVTIGACFFAELILVRPSWSAVVAGLVPSAQTVSSRDAWAIAVGIVGATVMPHNLYLHSSIVQTRVVGEEKGAAIRFATLDAVGSLALAMLVNGAILVLAASAFHGRPGEPVADIETAYHLLDPIVGGAFAGTAFAVALLASGQSSTFTGTIAGQIVMEGFLRLWIPCWQRRLITRFLALAPALAGVLLLGDGATGKLLVWSQIVLSFQLPFAIVPLLLFTSDRELMGRFRNGAAWKLAGWGLCLLIAGANTWLLVRTVAGA